MRCSSYGNGGLMHVYYINGDPLEEVDCFRYLGSQLSGSWWRMWKWCGTKNEREWKAWGALKSVMSKRGLGNKAKKCLYEGVIVPTALYRAEAWGKKSVQRKNVNVLEMKCLGTLVGVSRMDGIERELASRADQRVLRWLGYVERMDEYHMARRVLMAEVSRGRVRGIPRLGWMDGGNMALGSRGMKVEAARQCAKDRKE